MRPDNFEYVGFWPRVGAFLIDSILFGIVYLLIIIPILSAFYRDYYWMGEQPIHGPTDFILFWAFPAIVVILFWWAKQATPGKNAVSVKIIDAKTGNTPSIGQCIGRCFSYFIAALPLGLGIIWVVFDKQKQGWHDKLSGTLVVRDPLLDFSDRGSTYTQQLQPQRPKFHFYLRLGLLLSLTGSISFTFTFILPNYPNPVQSFTALLSIWIGLAFLIAACAERKKLSPTRYFFASAFLTPLIGFIWMIMNKSRQVDSNSPVEELSIASGDIKPASNAWKTMSKLQLVAGILFANIFLATLLIEYRSISDQLSEDGRTSSNFDNKRDLLTRFQDAIINEDLDQIRLLLSTTSDPLRTDVFYHVYCKECSIRHLMDLSVATGNLDIVSEIMRTIEFTPEQRGQLLETALINGHSLIANRLSAGNFILELSNVQDDILVKRAISIGARKTAEKIAIQLAFDSRLSKNPNYIDESGWSPLMHRIYEQNIRTVSNLISNGAYVNFRDSDGNTPLIIAASVGFVEGVDLLIQNGADFFATNHDGISAYEAAKYNKHSALADILNKKKNEAVKVIQEGLYNLRYDPGPIDGRLGNNTISAIKLYQKHKNFPIDGNPTLEIYHNLNGASLPGPWGAIAYSLSGRAVWRWNATSRQGAEEGLQSQCESVGESCPLMFAINGNECTALAISGEYIAGLRFELNINDAKKSALEYCSKTETDCLIQVAFCADGRHNQ